MLLSPYAFIHIEQVEANMKAMADRLRAAGIDHWPHIKTHKSVRFARMQMAFGAKGITVAKLSEAEVMAEAGIGPLLIAFPIIGEQNLLRLQKLAQKTKIRTIVDSSVVAEGLSRAGEAIGAKIEVLIEIDPGTHRGGVQPGQGVLDLAQVLDRLPGIELVGVMTYSGQLVYGAKSEEDIMKLAETEAKLLTDTKALLLEHGFKITVTSGGSTPASFYPEHMQGISESRAGNYVFGDRKAVALGLMKEEECALRVSATVVSTPLPGYSTIDAGSKTLTTDLSMMNTGFGGIVGKPGVELAKLNEEHGYLRFDPEHDRFDIGERVEIIPNHSCVIPNLCDKIALFREGVADGYVTVDARGKNY
ncbi:MAG: D-threonine aldolase [Paenibacillus sp.]|jgi:D-serine deaminase-like pyridoxal phosphate-dependent protein|nr:D-threonine aldolase [Paenibacillus sp.]